MPSTQKVIYPELSYRIIGILFKVHRELGWEYQEKYYQRAVSLALAEGGIKFKERLKVPLNFNSKSIGYYELDFLIEDKIILELKAAPRINRQNIRQVLAYLKAENLKLGIIANFRTPSLKYIRVLNVHI